MQYLALFNPLQLTSKKIQNNLDSFLNNYKHSYIHTNYQKLINDPTQIDTVANQIVLINLDNNKIFLTYPNDSKTTHLAAYDIDTGATYYDTIISDPMVSDLNIFQNNICLESSDGQTNLNLSCRNEDSGQLTWQANLADVFIQPVTPVITNNIVAALGNDSLNFYDINNGALLSSTSSTSYQIDPRLRTTMTIDSNDQNVITTSDSYGRPMTITNIQNPKNEINIDIAAQNMIATAKNVIYHHSLAPDYKSGISAYDENTGKKLWTTVLPDEWLYAATNPIITDNILFDSITTENGVFYTLAIDLKTHQIVWTHQGELLALTNNTLYISGGSRNVLVAISLS